VAFNSEYSAAPSAIVISAGSERSGQDIRRVFITNITTTSFEIRSTANAIATGDHKFYFIVVE